MEILGAYYRPKAEAESDDYQLIHRERSMELDFCREL